MPRLSEKSHPNLGGTTNSMEVLTAEKLLSLFSNPCQEKNATLW
jgi:hypothetical protein